METIHRTTDESQTLDLARTFATDLPAGTVVALEGDLGAGKTRFAKGMALGLGVDDKEVDSPTFTLVRSYRGRGGREFHHFDFYRIGSPREALDIGVEEYFYGKGISAVEWPDKIADLLPCSAIRVFIETHSDRSRTIRIVRPDEPSGT